MRPSRLFYYYALVSVICLAPVVGFVILHLSKTEAVLNETEAEAEVEVDSPGPTEWTFPIVTVTVFLCLQTFISYGIQDAFGNLLTTFSVLGPVHFLKTTGVALTALYWTSSSVGRFTGQYFVLRFPNTINT